jgi:2-polyprenyl-6-methoxyphenol hydroxylase-like FAD-dependent oxidoreductase
MSTVSFHVLIIGGGLGGLCLAQGLKKAGISVAVFERDRTPHDRLQGYRIHIEPQGNQALYSCLPPHLFDTYVSTSGSGGNGHRIVTDQLKELVFFRAPAATDKSNPAELDLSVSRITLRQVLLAELDEIVHFNKSFTHFQERPDGKITAYFEGGASAAGDVLVAADGSNSRVRQQFLPQAKRVETGVGAIMGKVPLTDEVRALLIPGRLDGATTILGPKGYGMFLALHELGQRPAAQPGAIGGNDAAALEEQPGLLFDNTSDYLFWAFIARQEKFPSPLNLAELGRSRGVESLTGPALHQVALGIVQGWHPNLQQLVGQAEPATVIYKPLRTSTPLGPWETKRITLVGDAIHSMPPTRGIGGNTALRDASLLCQKLVAAQQGEKPLLQTIHDYEAEMIKYSFKAVRDSMQAMNMIVAERRFFYNLMLKLAAAFS